MRSHNRSLFLVTDEPQAHQLDASQRIIPMLEKKREIMNIVTKKTLDDPACQEAIFNHSGQFLKKMK